MRDSGLSMELSTGRVGRPSSRSSSGKSSRIDCVTACVIVMFAAPIRKLLLRISPVSA